jgi:hypothetical protein
MGIGLLELTFMLEKKLNVRFDSRRAVPELTHAQCDHGTTWLGSVRSDWKVNAFYDCLSRHFYQPCARCRKSPAAQSPQCRKCGATLTHAELNWQDFRNALAEMLGKPSDAIQPDMWLVGDLGFS